MAELPYEEEKERKRAEMPVYENSSPIGTYYGEQGNKASDMAEVIYQRAAEAADPARQAEQDARIQRSRKFWTGANLFANVVANAINVNGTANNAPNMTWNDAPTQKMYDTWRTADKELRAERRAAAQRLDALQMEDAKLRAAGAEKRAAEQQRANDMNFKIALENANYERAKADKDAARDAEWAHADEVRSKQWEHDERMARIRAARSGGGSRGGSRSGSSNLSVSIGSLDIPVNDKNEAQKVRKDVANKIVERMNELITERNKNAKLTDQEELLKKPKNDKEAEAIIYQWGDLYDEDDSFREGINGGYGVNDLYAEEDERELHPGSLVGDWGLHNLPGKKHAPVRPSPQWGMQWKDEKKKEEDVNDFFKK